MQMQAPLPSYATKVPRWAILPSALTVVVASTNASLSYALHGLLMSLIITLDNVAAVHCAKSRYNTVKKKEKKAQEIKLESNTAQLDTECHTADEGIS